MKDPYKHEVEGCEWCPFYHVGDFDPSRCSHPDVGKKKLDENTKGFGGSGQVPSSCPLRDGPVWIRLDLKDD